MTATTSTPLEATNPSDFIEGWGNDNIDEDGGVPAPETLEQVRRALHAVNEFLVEPVAKTLTKVSNDAAEKKPGRVSEGKRTVTYENIGRLIAFTDELRVDVGYLLDEVAEIVLLAHEDFQAIAEGWGATGFLRTGSGPRGCVASTASIAPPRRELAGELRPWQVAPHAPRKRAVELPD